MKGASWIINFLQINSILWLTKIKSFLDQGLVMVFLLKIGNYRMFKNCGKTVIWYFWKFRQIKKSSFALLFLWKMSTIKILKMFYHPTCKDNTNFTIYKTRDSETHLEHFWRSHFVFYCELILHYIILSINDIILKITGKLQTSCSN